MASAERLRHRRIQTFISCARKIRIAGKEFSKLQWRFRVVPRAQQSTFLSHCRPHQKTCEDIGVDGRGWRSHFGCGDDRPAHTILRDGARQSQNATSCGMAVPGFLGTRLESTACGVSKLEVKVQTIRKGSGEKPDSSWFPGEIADRILIRPVVPRPVQIHRGYSPPNR